MAGRDYKCPLYKEWRQKVLRRDGYKCGMCNSKKRLHTHHIQTWASCPSLRFVESNGITLCSDCHGRVTLNELTFQNVLSRLVDFIYKKQEYKRKKKK